MVWWTNLLGEKHTRVLGGHGLTTGARLRIGENGQRVGGPPLSYAELLYPEHVARVKRGSGSETLVGVCDCGAVGSFQALGWIGPCCGPCRDHRMDGNLAPPVPWHSAGVNDPPSVQRLVSPAFDPDGSSLLFIFSELRRWYFRTGVVEPVARPPGIRRCWKVTFLPDGKRAVLFGSGENEDASAVAVWEPGAATGSVWHLPVDDGAVMCLAPDGETIAISQRDHANAKTKLRICSLHDGKVLRELEHTRSAACGSARKDGCCL